MNNKKRLITFLEKHPKDSFSLYALALEERKTGNDDEAIVLLKKVIDIDESNLGAYYQLAELYIEQEKSELAKKITERGVNQAKKKGDEHAEREFKELLTIHF